MGHYTTVVPQHIGAIADSLPTQANKSAIALFAAGSPIQVPLMPEQAPTLIQAHISPLVTASASGSPSSSRRYHFFDNETVHRLTDLVHLRELPQNADNYTPLPKPSSKVKEVIPSTDGGSVQIWLDGSLLKVKKPQGTIKHSGGGKRSIVLGFSKASRRRLLQKIATIDKESTPLFVTLTYPSAYPLEAAEWKSHFDKWCKRLHRAYPQAALIWRLEPQRRGAPHFHVLLYGVPLSGQAREWVRKAWYECVASGDPKHYRHGTDMRKCDNSRAVRSYVGKYLAKTQAAPQQTDEHGEVQSVDWSRVGRWWGVRYGENLPLSRVVANAGITFSQSARLMRYLRKYVKAQSNVRLSGGMPSMNVYINNPVQWHANLFYLMNGGSPNEDYGNDNARSFWQDWARKEERGPVLAAVDSGRYAAIRAS